MNKLISQLKEGISLLSSKEYAKAKAKLHKLTTEHPENPDVWQLLGAAEKNLKNYKQAKICYQKSLAISRNQPQVLNNYGNLLFSLNEYSEALSAYQHTLELHPNNPDALFNLANTLLRLGRSDLAIAAYKNASKILPTSHKIMLGLAESLIEAGEIQQARTILETPPLESTNELASLFKAGTLYRRIQLWGSAIEKLTAAANLSPSSAPIHHHIASCYAACGKFTDAKLHFETCIKLEPHNPEHHYWLNAMLWINEDKDFLLSYTKIEAPQSSARLALDHIRFLKSAGNKTLALEKIVRLHSDQNQSLESTLLHSEILREEKRQVEARRTIDIALKKDPSQSELIDEKIRVLIEEGDLTAAQDLLDKRKPSRNTTQSLACLQATILKLSKNEKYFQIANYNTAVQCQKINPGAGYSSLPDYLSEIKQTLLNLHVSKQAPIEQSLENGTQSFEDLFRYQNPIIQSLKNEISSIVKRYIASLPIDATHPFYGLKRSGFLFSDSWSVQLRSGGKHRSHYHPKGWISSVLYIDLPNEIETGGQGWLEFGIPDLQITPQVEADYYIKPEPGLLVLFPSYFWHGTKSFYSSSNRLTIAFDIVPANG